ncbi:hypothetical protein [Streptomyces sp. A1547]|uniref:hypothetical protein n=1 Tax=Streptomyces sp. A1547 TaxID=2563105 RepID=UPI00109EA510|nr:hypothetical protein [Streptomyces sp. A1547]THA41363.1 hypothetical protein E6W17_00035 [Streptomyces sp. A1547]
MNALLRVLSWLRTRAPLPETFAQVLMVKLLRVSTTHLLVVRVAWPPPNPAYGVLRPPMVLLALTAHRSASLSPVTSPEVPMAGKAACSRPEAILTRPAALPHVVGSTLPSAPLLP